MESTYPDCDHAPKSVDKECTEDSACAKETKQQEDNIMESKQVNISSAKTENVPATTSEEIPVAGKAQMSLPSVRGCAEALQKLLLQQPANNVKRLIISAQSLTHTTTRTETTTHALPSAAPAGAAPEIMLLATSTQSETCAQRDTLVQEQSGVVPHVGDWKETSNPAEIARFTPKPHIVDLPLDLVYTVPKVKTRVVKYTIEAPIPGISRLVPKAFPVDTPFIVPQISDVDVPVVMSQTFVPELEECSKVIEIPAARYVPKLVPVDVYVPRPVAIPIKTGELKQYSKPAQVSEELLHQLSVEMNPHLVALNQYNTRQAAKFSSVVKRSVELANALGVPPPVPERIEIDLRHQKSHCSEMVDEHGFKQLILNLNGHELESVDAAFQRVKREADASRKPVVQITPVAEDYILSVVENGNSRQFQGIPSGYPSTAFLPLIPQEQRGHPCVQRLNDGAIAETSGTQTVPGSPQPEEGNTTVARPGITSPLSD